MRYEENFEDLSDDDLESVGCTVIKTISNKDTSVRIVKRADNEVYSDDGIYIGNAEDEDFEDKLYDFEEDWHNANWDNSDLADWYGCDEDEVEDAMDDDIKDWF